MCSGLLACERQFKIGICAEVTSLCNPIHIPQDFIIIYSRDLSLCNKSFLCRQNFLVQRDGDNRYAQHLVDNCDSSVSSEHESRRITRCHVLHDSKRIRLHNGIRVSPLYLEPVEPVCKCNYSVSCVLALRIHQVSGILFLIQKVVHLQRKAVSIVGCDGYCERTVTGNLSDRDGDCIRPTGNHSHSL